MRGKNYPDPQRSLLGTTPVALVGKSHQVRTQTATLAWKRPNDGAKWGRRAVVEGVDASVDASAG